LLAFERFYLLDCCLELMRDPGIGATLAHPSANPI
jgi:hypothetical protein